MIPAIRVENLSKKYRVVQGKPRAGYRTLRESLVHAAAAPFRRLRRGFADTDLAEDFWALKDVAFEVQPGEVVGVIGRNGAGKSTLLKILSRITKPTTGRVEINGRVGSLLEVGTGFHPELTGRENVYLNGSILGMSKKEIDRRFDEIVAFAEVEQFLDTPVKRYSSGMYVRLAFAVAAHLEPEILVVDEVLAVGDTEFQKKCMAKMRDVGRRGATVLVVSHNLAVVENLCARVAVLNAGRVIGFGDTTQQLRVYLNQFRRESEHIVDLTETPLRYPTANPLLTAVTIEAGGKLGTVMPMGGRLGLTLSYSLPAAPESLRVGLAIEDQCGTRVISFSPTFQQPTLLHAAPRAGTVRLDVPWLNLVEGDYHINLYCEADELRDQIEHACKIQITAADVFGTGRLFDGRESATYLPGTWTTGWTRPH